MQLSPEERAEVANALDGLSEDAPALSPEDLAAAWRPELDRSWSAVRCRRSPQTRPSPGSVPACAAASEAPAPARLKPLDVEGRSAISITKHLLLILDEPPSLLDVLCAEVGVLGDQLASGDAS
jgi:hypothetical protein